MALNRDHLRFLTDQQIEKINQLADQGKLEGPKLPTRKTNAPNGGLVSIGGRYYRCSVCNQTVTADCSCCEVQHFC